MIPCENSGPARRRVYAELEEALGRKLSMEERREITLATLSGESAAIEVQPGQLVEVLVHTD